MSFSDVSRDERALEACLDEIGDFLSGLERYPPPLLAVALRVHLEALLQALLENRRCTREELHEFIRELEREALQYDDASG